MGEYLYNKIESLIHDTNDAFQSCGGGMNADYAEFAGMAISDFKSVLGKPNLKQAELIYLLRKSMAKSRCDDPNQWTILMAKQLKKAANRTEQ